jgi:hypothetical protein
VAPSGNKESCIASQLSYLRLLVGKSLPGKLNWDIFVAWEIEHPCKLLTD